MTSAQKVVLQDVLKDENVTLTTIEYPASTGADTFRCLKLCYLLTVGGTNRHFVDWYGVEGGVVATREIESDRHPAGRR